MSEKDYSESANSEPDRYDDARDLPPEGSSEHKKEEKDDFKPDELTRDQKESGENTEAPTDDTENMESAEQPTENVEENVTPPKTVTLEEIKEKYKEEANIHQMCKYYYTIGCDTFITHAQEPWPKDVKLFQPYEVEQILLPDNAHCLAVQAFLKMCNLDFQIELRANAEFMSPSGKVPFIKCGAFVVSELEGIVNFVSQKGITLTDLLEAEQKSDLRAYISLIEHVLGNAEAYVCWCDNETYREVTKPRNGSVYPWPLNIIQTWSKRSKEMKRLKTLGWYDKTLDEVFQEVETCCQALCDRLENSTYFFGNNFTELDALTYGHVCTILTNPLPAGSNQLAFLVNKFDKLVNHCKMIDKEIMGRETTFEVKPWERQPKSAVTDTQPIEVIPEKNHETDGNETEVTEETANQDLTNTEGTKDEAVESSDIEPKPESGDKETDWLEAKKEEKSDFELIVPQGDGTG